MLNSQTIWDKLNIPNLNKDDWRVWLNKYGADGTLLDTDDNVSFIHDKLSKAVKITCNPEDGHELSHWESRFGDEESGIVQVLNIVCKQPTVSMQKQIEKLIGDWLQV